MRNPFIYGLPRVSHRHLQSCFFLLHHVKYIILRDWVRAFSLYVVMYLYALVACVRVYHIVQDDRSSLVQPVIPIHP